MKSNLIKVEALYMTLSGYSFECVQMNDNSLNGEPYKIALAMNKKFSRKSKIYSPDFAKQVIDRLQIWDMYFKRKDQIGRLVPASALTIHKSQGSTFRHVFLHWSVDGWGSAPTAIQNQLSYVGITRAAESLHVVADRW